MNTKQFKVSTGILGLIGLVLIISAIYFLLELLPKILIVVVFAAAGYLIFPDKALITDFIQKIKLGGKK